MKNQDAILVKIAISVSSPSHFFNFWEKIWYQMDPERCQNKPGGFSKLWHQSGLSFLHIFIEKSTIKNFSISSFEAALL